MIYMNTTEYYHKYLKYKNKYLQLQSTLKQKGGGQPNIKYIKGIDILAGSPLYDFLSPIWGVIWLNTGILKNYFNFYKDKDFGEKDDPDYIIGIYVNKVFNNVGNILQPTNKCYHRFDTYKIGIFLGLKYFNIVCKDLVNNIKTEKVKLYKDKPKQRIIEKKIDELKLKKEECLKFINNEYEYKEIFHVILAMMYYMSNDDKGIIKYYCGINGAIQRFNSLFESARSLLGLTIQDIPYIAIPAELSEYGFDELNIGETDDFKLALAISCINKMGLNIVLYQQRYVNYNEPEIGQIYYADCGESCLRNFFNILIYDKTKSKFDIAILEKYMAIDNLKEYYLIFDNLKKQSDESITYSIFGKKLDSRNAWSIVVSNLDKVKYRNELKSYKYELDAGKALDGITLNFLQAIKELLKNIDSFDSFEKEDFENIEVKVNSTGIGDIITTNKNGNFIHKLLPSHYQTELKEDDNEVIFTDPDIEKKCILKSISGEIIDYLYELAGTPYMLNDKFFMFINYDDNKLLRIFNDFPLSDKFYQLLFNYIFGNYKDNSDYMRRLKLDIDRIDTEIYQDKLNKLGCFFDETGNYKKENIISMNATYLNNLYKFTNLRELKLDNLAYLGEQDLTKNIFPFFLETLRFQNDFDAPIPANILPNSLTSLIFGGNFDQPIGEKVLPESLKSLTFGTNFDQPIGKGVLPDNLQTLNFGSMYNQPIGEDVLPENLQTLKFVGLYDQPIGEGVLPKNLQTLNLTSIYNQPIGVNVLPENLEILTFGRNFNQPIGEGVLPESLKKITLPDSYPYEIEHDCNIEYI